MYALGVPEIGAWYDAEAYIEVWIERSTTEIKEIKIFDDLNIIEDDSLSASVGKTSCNSSSNAECLLDHLHHLQFLEV